MREFQDYTKAPHAARWRRMIWWLPTGLVVALMVGLGVWVGAVPTASEAPCFSANGGSGAGPDALSRDEWLQGVLVGSPEISGGPLNVLVLGVDERPPGSEEAQVYGCARRR